VKLKNVTTFELNPERDTNARRLPARTGVAERTLSVQTKVGGMKIKTKNRALCPYTGKRRYRDPQSAKMALRRSQSAGRLEREMYGTTRRQEIRQYFCAYCSAFHLTSQQAMESLATHGSLVA